MELPYEKQLKEYPSFFMEQDNSFQALTHPGEASNFFDIANLTEFDPRSKTSYNRTNALWLAEFCRLIYRQEKDEIKRSDGFLTRNHFLAAKGWREDTFFNHDGTQAGLFVNQQLNCGALVFRGTLGLKDVMTDLECLPTLPEGGGYVHNGFKRALDAVWDDGIKPALRKLDFPLFFTGHSLGAALATLAAARCILDPDLKNSRPEALYTFGSPRVGDKAFGAALQGLFHCRLVNDKDIITTVPPVMLVGGIATFQHVGQLHHLEPEGNLHIFPPDEDVFETRCPLRGPIKILALLKWLLARVLAIRIEPPKPLRDHTPVNYTARLEKAASGN